MGLRDFFFKDNEEFVPEKKQEEKQEKQTVNPPVLNTTSNTDYRAHLDDVLAKNNQSGTDFYEFNKAIGKLDGKPLPEQQKYEIAFSTLEAMGGADVTTLLTSAKKYLVVLTEEEQQFDREMEEAERIGVVDRKQEIEKLARENAELTKKINDNNTKTQQLNQQIFDSTNQLATEKQAFKMALQERINLIQSRMDNIKNYLNATTNK